MYLGRVMTFLSPRNSWLLTTVSMVRSVLPSVWPVGSRRALDKVPKRIRLAWPASVVRVVPWEEQNGQAGARSAAASTSANARTAKVARRKVRVIRGLRGGECRAVSVEVIMRPQAGAGQAASAGVTRNGRRAA